MKKCFLPMQSLNVLRREGLKKLEKEYLSKFRRVLPEKTFLENDRKSDNISQNKAYVQIETWEPWKAALEEDWVAGIYCGLSVPGWRPK